MAGVGVDVSQRYPTGPTTLGGLRELRTRVLENPPEEFSLSAERLLDAPPNWISFQIHTLFALSLFAILAALLGALTAGLTTGLSPPARKNARWASGLASGVLFFIGESLGGEWVRADALHSGVLGAWGAMVIPVLELAFLYLLLLLRTTFNAFCRFSVR